MTVLRTQTFAVQARTSGSSPATFVYTNVPTAANLLVLWVTSGDGGGAVTISSVTDDIGDGVSWTAMTPNPVGISGSANNQLRGYYKTVGTPSGGGKTISVATTGSQVLSLFAAEYGFSGTAPIWTVDGSQVSASGTPPPPANAGNIVVSGTDNVLIGANTSSGTVFNAGTGFTRQATSSAWASDAVQDRIISSASTYAAEWSTSSGVDGAWGAMGISFNVVATPTGPTVSTVSNANANEGSNVVHTVTLSAAATGTENYASSLAGSGAHPAVNGVNFSTSLGACTFSNGVTFSTPNLVVPSGVSSFTVTVPTTDDGLYNYDLTYTLTVGGIAGTGTINNTDAPPVVDVGDAVTITAGDPSVFTVTLNESARDCGGTLELIDDTAIGGVDFDTPITDAMLSNGVTIVADVITIPAGVTSFTVTVPTTA